MPISRSYDRSKFAYVYLRKTAKKIAILQKSLKFRIDEFFHSLFTSGEYKPQTRCSNSKFPEIFEKFKKISTGKMRKMQFSRTFSLQIFCEFCDESFTISLILTIFTQIHSNHQIYLMISIINSQHLYGKPPTLLRDLGSKNPDFFSKSAF